MAPFKKKSDSSSSSAAKAPPTQSTDASSAGAVAATNSGDEFSARRSARVSTGRYAADNDTWVEALAVCEIPAKPGYGDKPSSKNKNANNSNGNNGGGLFSKFKSKNTIQNTTDEVVKIDVFGPTPKEEALAAASQRLTLRPYFQSQNTGQRVWDEPPSGASNIVYATPEARKMAQAQLEEMRETYAHAALSRRVEREEKKAAIKSSTSEQQQDSSSNNNTGIVGGSARNLIPKAFRRSSSEKRTSDKKKQHHESSSLLENNYSNMKVKGKLVLSDEGGKRGIPKSILTESKELAGQTRKAAYEDDLQKAMLMSLEIGGGSVMGTGGENHRHQHNGSRSSSRSSRHRTPSPANHNHNMKNNSNNDNNGGTSLTREEQEQLAMATAMSLSEQETYHSHAVMGGDGVGYAKKKQQQRKQEQYDSNNEDDNMAKALQTSEQEAYGWGDGSSNISNNKSGAYAKQNSNSSSRSSRSNYANITANMEPSLASLVDFDENFDGGGKMPAKKDNRKKGQHEQHDVGEEKKDFEDRGHSWELSWSKSD